MDNSTIIGIVIGVVVFIAIREIVCWYYKINEIIDRLDSVEYRLEENTEILKHIEQTLDYIRLNGINVRVISNQIDNNEDDTN